MSQPPPFRDVVTREAELRLLYGEPSDIARRKDIGRLDAHSRAFIAHAPFVLVATSGADGRCDVSPKGDAPGFVHVLDDRHLAIPDRPGNRRLDGYANVLANPHVGLIFIVPGREDTLRVNGRAWITRDPDLLARMIVRGKTPQTAIGVEVEECFIHCAKAFKRSQLWEAGSWPPPDAIASLAQVVVDQLRPENMTVADVEARLQDGYTKHLY
jgi:PPOX class probable FMN-dependent enzyme